MDDDLMTNPNSDSSRFSDRWQQDERHVEDLRYGENPHQEGAVYRDEAVTEANVIDANQLNEMADDLSYVNYLDAAAALEVVKEFDEPAATVIKHAFPAGCATAVTVADAYERAHRTDPMSAFGGIVGLNRECDVQTANNIRQSAFKHLVVAPGYTEQALETLQEEDHLRILEVEQIGEASVQTVDKHLVGGRLVQDRDVRQLSISDLEIVTDIQPTESQQESLLFAWHVVKHVPSNATVLATGTETVGVGSGQPSRIDSVQVALRKGREHAEGKEPAGAVLATDGFVFPDTVQAAADVGIETIIQPGGSQRDDEVIATADEYDIPMVFTGVRCFKHG